MSRFTMLSYDDIISSNLTLPWFPMGFLRTGLTASKQYGRIQRLPHFEQATSDCRSVLDSFSYESNHSISICEKCQFRHASPLTLGTGNTYGQRAETTSNHGLFSCMQSVINSREQGRIAPLLIFMQFTFRINEFIMFHACYIMQCIILLQHFINRILSVMLSNELFSSVAI